MNSVEFGLKIKARREELGLSQADLAMEMKLDQGKVSLIERGARKVDSVKELPALSKVLKKPITWFYESEEDILLDDPVEDLLAEFFPGVSFTDFEVRRIKQFLEPVVDSYIKHDPEMRKKM